MKKFLQASALLILSTNLIAATIAVIDSGTDMRHEMIAPKAWINPVDKTVDNVDDDRNGYLDDIFGWNFAEGNNMVIDYKYLGTFGPDVFKFFEIQKKNYFGIVSREEVEWVKAKMKDKEFVKQLSIYGNFMHGTHVAGIAAMNAKKAKLLAIKLLPTEINLPGGESEEDGESQQEAFSKFLKAYDVSVDDDELADALDNFDEPEGPKPIGPIVKKMFKKGLSQIAEQQMNLLKEISYYCYQKQATVANGSFGTGFRQAAGLIYQVFKMALRKEPTPEDLFELTKYFLQEVIKNGQQMVSMAPRTLFVFAAGNDNSNNDIFPSSPTNISAPNEISVAATFSNVALATFSNYGAKTVDVAAPGVAIRSAVPGNQYLEVSGTSQAAPYVANMAGQIQDINPRLTPRYVKAIIEATVDVKDFLRGKVRTSGIVNARRAFVAAQHSLSMDLKSAIAKAKADVADVPAPSFKSNFLMPLTPFTVPLRSEFVIKK